MSWFHTVANDLSRITDCIAFFEGELDEAKFEVKIRGSLEKSAADIPGIVEHRFGQLQEIEAILEHLNIDLKKIKSDRFRQLLEHYARALTSRDAQIYVDGDQNVVNHMKIINEFSLLRNRYLGIIKGLETKQFQINNIVKLRTAGLEDATI